MNEMIKAVIFDMDGVISDTQTLQSKVEEEILKEFRIKLSAEEITRKYGGFSDKEFFEKIFSEYGIEVNISKVIQRKWKQVMNLLNGYVTPMPGAKELINELKKHNIKLAVASSSPRKFVELVLSSLGIKDKFDVIISSEDVDDKSKPDPSIFLKTAKILNVAPDDCVVIEDSLNGMLAAKRAGMKCIGLIKSNNCENSHKKYPADILVTSLETLSAENLLKMF